MSRGEGGEVFNEEDIPMVADEIEVEAEVPPAEVQGVNKNVHLRRLPPPPRVPKLRYHLAPFKTPKAFGDWVFEVMDRTMYQCVYALFVRYYVSICMKNFKRLVAFGKASLQSVHQLYFLEGLFMVAPYEKQKRWVSRVYGQQIKKYFQNQL